jgi:uncharacterized protein YjbI with pentapeptide repeats
MNNSTGEDTMSEITSLQQSLQILQSNLQSSIYDLENRLNSTRAMNDFSYLNFENAELFNFNNGLGAVTGPAIWDFADLRNATLTYSNFSNSSFVNANMAGSEGLFSDFQNADFTSAQMAYGVYRNSDFSGAEMVNTGLRYTDFRWSNLSDVNLTGASIYGGGNWMSVDLSNADLTNAMMWDLDLRFSNLTGADLTGARLAQLNSVYGDAILDGVIWDWATCPDGTAAWEHDVGFGQTCVNNL